MIHRDMMILPWNSKPRGIRKEGGKPMSKKQPLIQKTEKIIKEKKTQKNSFRNRDFYSADSDCRCFYICKTWQDEFYES